MRFTIKYKRPFVLVFVCLFLFSGLICTRINQRTRAKPESSFLLPPPQGIKHLTFGYQQALADVLWLRAIQDLDYCRKEESNCTKGWLFKMLDLITQLVPNYRMPYAAGVLMLSVVVDDREGASVLYERGVKNFPKDWPLAYRAAYHYIYEDPNYERAAELLIQAAKNGGPWWFYSLASRIYSKQGRQDVGRNLLRILEGDGVDEDILSKVKLRIEMADELKLPHEIENSQEY